MLRKTKEKTSPYVYLAVGDQTASTQSIQNNAHDPYFGQEFAFAKDAELTELTGEEELLLQVYSQAKAEPNPTDGGDELLGELKVSLAHMMSGEELTKPLSGEGATGTLTFRVALVKEAAARSSEPSEKPASAPGHGRRLTIDASQVHENPLAQVQRAAATRGASDRPAEA